MVPVFDPLMVPTREPVIVPDLLDREPVMVPPNATAERAKISMDEMRNCPKRFILSPSEPKGLLGRCRVEAVTLRVVPLSVLQPVSCTSLLSTSVPKLLTSKYNY